METPISEPVAQPVSAEPQKPKSSKLLIPLVTLLAVAAFFAVSYTQGLWPFGPKMEAVVLSPTPTPTPSSASLKTYTNAKYGFEIKYPTNWPDPILNDTTTSNGQQAVNLSFPQMNSDQYAIQMVNMTTFISKGSVEGNVTKFLSDFNYIKWEKEFSVANGKAFYYVNTTSKAGPAPSVFLVGSNSLWLMISDDMKFKDNLLAVASTFKFTGTTTSLLRVCPEKWYYIQPTVVGDTSLREYYIYKGVRRELSEFDTNWVKANCTVQRETVQ